MAFADIMGKFDYKVTRAVVSASPLDLDLDKFNNLAKKAKLVSSQPKTGSAKSGESSTHRENTHIHVGILSLHP